MLGDLRPTASWDTFAFNAAGLAGRDVRLMLDPVMGRADAVDLARVGESEQVAAGMRLVRGAARRAVGAAGGRAADGRRRPVRAAHRDASASRSDAATVERLDPRHRRAAPAASTLSAGGRTLGSAIAGKSWRAVRVPVAALRGRRVALTVASADATGLQLAYVGTVQRAPALHVRRFVPAEPDAPPGQPDGRRGDRARARSPACASTLEQRAGSGPGSASAPATLKVKGARVVLKVKLPRRAAVRAVFTGSEAVAAGTSPVRTRRA